MNNEKKGFYLSVNGQLVEVGEEVYNVYLNERRETKNRRKRDKRNRLVSYNNFDVDEMNGEEILVDGAMENIENIALQNVMIERLNSVLSLLEPDEYHLVYHIFYLNKSEREYSKITGIPQKTINDRKRKILYILHKLLENEK